MEIQYQINLVLRLLRNLGDIAIFIILMLVPLDIRFEFTQKLMFELRKNILLFWIYDNARRAL